MADSLGQKIARKLAHTNGADGARIIWPIDVHTVAALIDAELAAERDAVEALEALTLLIRNMVDLYGAEQAKWIMSKPTFQKAEECAARLRKLRGE